MTSERPSGAGQDADGAGLGVDWGVALATARRVGGRGPRSNPSEVAAAIDGLREAASVARTHVAEITRMDASASHSPVAVVNRSGWSEANAAAMSRMLAPLLERARQRPPDGDGSGRRSGASKHGLVDRAGAAVAGVEAGVLLGFLSSRVLGQFDPFYDGEPETDSDTRPTAGRLLLVAPNIVAAAEALDVSLTDFSLWVCMHEETHRVQFSAVPWLGEHMLAEIDAFVAEAPEGGAELLDRLVVGLREAAGAVRGGKGLPSLLDLVQTPEQRVVVDRVTAMMALLEGHADVVMDLAAERAVVPVGVIRERFEGRRDGAGGVDRALRQLLGMDAKVRQYREGARFVREVTEEVGEDGFAAVWTSPSTLPSAAEIAQPSAWVRRVHG